MLDVTALYIWLCRICLTEGHKRWAARKNKKELCWSGNLNKFVPSDKPYGFQQIRWICLPLLEGWNIVSLAITTCLECNLKLCFESCYILLFQSDCSKFKWKKLLFQETT